MRAEGKRLRKGARRHVIGLVFAVFAVSIAGSGGSLWAQDPPHWSSVSMTIDCTSQCHLNHQALGSALTSSAGNVNLCQSCHNSAGLAGDQPLNNSDKAVPQTGGTSHAFDVDAVNVGLSTLAPLDTEMNLRVMGGKVVCSTCHNQHRGELIYGGTSQVRPANQITVLGSTGAITSGGTFNGAEGVWYLVEITKQGNQTNAEFQYSKDNGTSWFAVQGAGTDVPLDSNVTVTFGAGNFEVGERWEFAGAWPFLRNIMDSGDNATGETYCRDCHRAWVMTHTEIEAYDGSYKSHPVGVALNANGQSYNRIPPLDGNGADQGTAGADANDTNDLRLSAGNIVQCLTCHGVHYVDSNTQTVDVP